MSGECREFPTVDEGADEIESCNVYESGKERAPNDQESMKTDTDLDAAIEEAAKRRNLSTLNVKSIIHHVLKDKRVLAFAQKHAAEQKGDKISEDEWDPENAFEPKLTRSRVRQAVASSIASGGISPEKRHVHLHAPSPVDDLLTTEESSDDEYNPEVEDTEEEEEDEEEENEDKREEEMVMKDKPTDGTNQPESAAESNICIVSAPGSPGMAIQDSPRHSFLKTTVSLSTNVDTEYTEAALMQETAALLASLSDVILSPAKSPKMDITQQSYEVCNESEDEEIIAKRTRSKHPLVDTSLSAIEASFVPPDAEDPPTPMELDPEDLEWQSWLNNLLNPSESLNIGGTGEGEEMEDGDDDVEYNFLADQEEVEKEEFRNDRAVKISKKEVDDLLCELLNPSGGAIGGFLSDDGLDLTGAYLLESIGLQPLPYLQSSVDGAAIGSEVVTEEGSEVGCCLSKDQSTQLWIQIQQHFQLLMQTFVLVRFEPSLQFLSKIAAQAIEEIRRFCWHGQEGTPKENCLWYVPHLEEGIELIRKLDPDNKDAVQPSPASGSHPRKLPPPVQDVLMDYALFWENPNILPSIAFDPLSSKDTSSSVKYFSAEEDYLLILGMDHYGISAWKIIQENLFQTKTARQLQLRVKNQCSNRTGDNAIKHYRKTKAVKIPFKEEDDQSKLPQWVIRYYKRKIEKDKQVNEYEKKREKENERQKLASVVGGVVKQSTLLQSKSTLLTTTAGSKRNLCGKLEELEQSKSKRTNTTVTDTKPMTQSQRNGNHRDSILVKGNLQQLLFAAGLEASDPDVRFAINYLTEVKATLSKGHDDVYQVFLDTLLKAKRENWTSKQIFEEVNKVLKSWPHLVKLFLEFLTPEDCIGVNMLAEKADLENTKSFARNLQEKFSKSPMKLGDVVTKLQELEDTGASVKMVQESLLPHIEMHEELVRDLRQFLYELGPSAGSDDTYEEINLVGELDKELDDFEEIVLTGPSTTLPNCRLHNREKCTYPLGKDSLSPRDPDDVVCHSELYEFSSQENPQTNEHDVTVDQYHSQIGSNTHKTSSSKNMNNATDQDSESCNCSSASHQSVPPKWTRKQDKLILQMCLKSQGDESSLNKAMTEIASSLDCDIRDVYSRFQELLALFKNSNQ